MLVLDRPHESVLMCLIRRSMAGDSNVESWPMAEGRLRAASSPEYPYRFITSILTELEITWGWIWEDVLDEI